MLLNPYYLPKDELSCQWNLPFSVFGQMSTMIHAPLCTHYSLVPQSKISHVTAKGLNHKSTTSLQRCFDVNNVVTALKRRRVLAENQWQLMMAIIFIYEKRYRRDGDYPLVLCLTYLERVGKNKNGRRRISAVYIPSYKSKLPVPTPLEISPSCLRLQLNGPWNIF